MLDGMLDVSGWDRLRTIIMSQVTLCHSSRTGRILSGLAELPSMFDCKSKTLEPPRWSRRARALVALSSAVIISSRSVLLLVSDTRIPTHTGDGRLCKSCVPSYSVGIWLVGPNLRHIYAEVMS
jgi:hypothetical protein